MNPIRSRAHDHRSWNITSPKSIYLKYRPYSPSNCAVIILIFPMFQCPRLNRLRRTSLVHPRKCQNPKSINRCECPTIFSKSIIIILTLMTTLAISILSCTLLFVALDESMCYTHSDHRVSFFPFAFSLLRLILIGFITLSGLQLLSDSS